MAADQSWNVDDLVMRDDNAIGAEQKLLIGGAVLAGAFYYAPRGGFLPELLKMVGGVLVAGAVRDLFWPPYKELSAAQRKDLTAQIME